MALRFTASGAVSSPTTVQIRLTHSFPGRVAAGAPSPSRGLSPEELVDNLRYFTVGLRGPRTQPCTSLVLAGVDLASQSGIAASVAQARAWGVSRVVLHLGQGDREALGSSLLQAEIDEVTLTVAGDRDIADVAALRRRTTRSGEALPVTAVVLLNEATLPRLELLARGLCAAGPSRVVLTWPFPPGTPPPRAERVAAALPSVVQRLDAAGVATGIKGLPACQLGSLSDRLWRSGNRWYVDAEHQQESALLFFPSVMRFAKGDVCRFCSLDHACDGTPEQWLEQGLAGRLRPL